MILQMIWLYISELAGKDLELSVIGKFIIYGSPTLIPLTLPLSILLASIMVFGEFSEHYEFAAMKSSGISLQRAMRTLTIFMVILSIGTFFVANNVIPASYKEFIGLRRNIVKMKPARAIVTKQFNEIGNLNIKVEKKFGENDQYLEDVIIHKQKTNIDGNYTVIKSKTGELVSAVDSEVLSLILRDGYYYDEFLPKKKKDKDKHPFLKSEFKELRMNVDLSELDSENVSENNYTRSRKMFPIKILQKDIDTFSIKINEKRKGFADRISNKMGFSSLADKIELPCITTEFPESIEHIYDYNYQQAVINEAIRDTRSGVNRIKEQAKEIQNETKKINKFEIALHEKYALAFACLVLFFIGAPLGSIIRKGGLGLPLLYAIGIFLVYHFIGIFAKNSAEDGTISPFLATWLSTIIILPLGILLTYRATTEKNLIGWDDTVGRFINPLVKFFRRKKKFDKSSDQ